MSFQFLRWLQGLLAGVSVLAFAGRWSKWFELASHFRMQYIWFGLVLLALAVYGRHWWMAGLALAVLLLNLSAVMPQVWPRPLQPTGGTPLKIILFNVEHRNEEYARAVAFLNAQQPDVIVVQEVTPAWVAALEPLRAQWPFVQTSAGATGEGLALYSRWSFAQAETINLTNDDRPAMDVALQINGVTLSLLTIHPRAPLRPGHYELRNAMLQGAVARLQQKAAPKLLLGDLNTTNWSPFFADMLRQTGLQDVRQGRGVLATWPVPLQTRWLMIPIDHCLVSADISVHSLATGPQLGSDHLPLIVTLAIPTLAAAAR